jgi:hypothetical protein
LKMLRGRRRERLRAYRYGEMPNRYVVDVYNSQERGTFSA